MNEILSQLLVPAPYIAVYMIIAFIIGSALKDNSIVDIAWGLGFVVATFSCVHWDALDLRKILILSLVLIWAFRLSGHLFVRNHGRGEDYRYANWRKEWGDKVLIKSFLNVYMLQGFVMWIICFPIIMAMNAPETQLGILAVIGLSLWLTGFLFESIGDWQLLKFKRSAPKDAIMNQGVWRYTRHPNYFGEATLWWGITLLCFTNPSHWWIFVSPIGLTILLLKVSGVAMLEKKYDGNPQYEKYVKTTSAFIPMPPREA